MAKMNKKNTRIHHSFSDRALNTVLTVIFSIFLAVVMYPLIYVLSSSFSSGEAVSGGRVILWPVEPTFFGYELVFRNKTVWTGYTNTLIYTVVGTVLNLVLNVMCAYPLSRRNFQGRSLYMIFFMIPMFFSGGLIPSYILITKLGLINTRWAIILSSGLSIFNMIMMRTFFMNSIPEELHEAAKIDGITDIGYLFKIVLPLSRAIMSVITLYYMVGHWNSYFTEMMYLRDRDKFPIQLILRSILSMSRVDPKDMQGMDGEQLSQMIGAADVLKYGLIVISTVPILCVYPFIQKYFEKGVMVGSVKG